MPRSKKQKVEDFTIVVDTREQIPWLFENMKVGTSKSRRQVFVKTTTGTLNCGDYSILGMEDKVSIERKSIEDLYKTLSKGRDRFIRELARMNELEFAAVIVESEWSDAMLNPPERSKMLPVSVDGMINAWTIRFPRVSWIWRPGRYVSSKTAFKLLSQFWKDKHGQE